MIGVAVVNFLQLGVIVLGIPLVAVMSLIKSGDSLAETLAHTVSSPFIPPGMFSQAVFIIVPFLLAISVSYDAFMRYQSAKSGQVAKWGCILGGLTTPTEAAALAVVYAVFVSLFYYNLVKNSYINIIGVKFIYSENFFLHSSPSVQGCKISIH